MVPGHMACELAVKLLVEQIAERRVERGIVAVLDDSAADQKRQVVKRRIAAVLTVELVDM